MDNINNYDIIIVGCGLSGCVMAERFATVHNKKVLIIEKRNHIGGNCYDYIDEETNIRVSKYGAHIFHTNDDKIWDYINRFSKWIRWEHKVLGNVDNKLIPIPVNITSVNILCNKNITNDIEMKEWLLCNQVKYDIIKNSEDMAKSRVGEDIYNKIFKFYTYKQWNLYPHELKPEVLERIPVRNNFDDRYFSDKYQALPENGYTYFLKNMLNNKNITVSLNTDFNKIKDTILLNKIIIYTGPIDTYFSDIGYDKLKYRSIKFIKEVYKNMNYYQPNSVVNYPSIDVNYTRIVEYKHFLNQQSPHTIIYKEVTTDEGEPYYPILNDYNISLYYKYVALAEEEQKKRNIHFIGRLANYKYFNMDQAIKNSLDYFENIFNKTSF